MRLGAQLYSVRKKMQTKEDAEETFARLKEIGYETVQLSGAADFEPEFIAELARRYGFDIALTHVSFDKIVNETEKVIEAHKVFGCPVIGLGAMPKDYRKTKAGLEEFFAVIAPAVEKIEAAGLKFAYHNHAFEFAPLEDTDGEIAYDIMLERQKNWYFIMDTYWVEFGGRDACDYIRRIGGDRLPNIHFKDMAKNEERSICACGDGVLDFEKIFEVCREVGVKSVFVEQDNASELGDCYEQMERSFKHLRPIIK
ncbi:MAG: sugar phosphate isomerase/epimerase [Ruminococcaceae bacterium]|nr:sugar phosphate isomerase/epimerase [Oscillospiraceae bacterium]